MSLPNRHQRLFTVLVGIGLFTALGTLDADDGPKWERKMERHGLPMTQRVAFVVDTSGSMRGEPLDIAKKETLAILGLFPDDGYFKLYTFADEVQSYQPDWVKLPDAEALEAAHKWLDGISSFGQTSLADGVMAALTNIEDDLAVVLMTDGDPSGDIEEHLEAILRANAARARPAPIHIVGIFEQGRRGHSLLLSIAEKSDGSYMSWSVVWPTPELPDDHGH